MGEVHFRSIPEDGAVGQTSFRTDRPTIEEPLRDVVGQAIASGSYADLPEFVRAWNEQRGWAAFENDGVPVPVAQLLDTAEAVLSGAAPHTVDVKVWKAFRTFVRYAVEQGTEHLWTVDE